MPSDKTIIALGQDPAWGHWEHQTFYVHPGVQSKMPFELNIEGPFEIHIGKGSNVRWLNQGGDFVCRMEQNACLYHLGTPQKAHFILNERATLIHKNVIQNLTCEASDIRIDLNGAEARVDWGDGVSLQQTERYRQGLKIEHFAPYTHSKCCLKSIIHDSGNLNFVCDVFVHENAVKSTAHQKNLNHVLSTKGHVTALPRLHIFNKDIEASHGTATQPIPEEILFYLQTRGLTRTQAEQLYLESFFQDFYMDNDGQ